jgi:hypothetical protein
MVTSGWGLRDPSGVATARRAISTSVSPALGGGPGQLVDAFGVPAETFAGLGPAGLEELALDPFEGPEERGARGPAPLPPRLPHLRVPGGGQIQPVERGQPLGDLPQQVIHTRSLEPRATATDITRHATNRV